MKSCENEGCVAKGREVMLGRFCPECGSSLVEIEILSLPRCSNPKCLNSRPLVPLSGKFCLECGCVLVVNESGMPVRQAPVEAIRANEAGVVETGRIPSPPTNAARPELGPGTPGAMLARLDELLSAMGDAAPPAEVQNIAQPAVPPPPASLRDAPSTSPRLDPMRSRTGGVES